MTATRHKWDRGIESTCTVCGLMMRMRMSLRGEPVYGDKEYSRDGGATWTRGKCVPLCEVRG